DAEVTVACLPQMARLLAQLPATVQPLTDRMAVAPHDFWTLPMSLPRWCGPDVPTGPIFRGTPRRSGGVGIAWRGNALPDPGRSLPPDLGAGLLALPGAVSLHPEDSGARDFQDTADLIAGLDLVVSIDTSVAHLAGAMGKPTLVLLQHNPPEWRWLADAAGRAAWHPSATVLRQPAPGDWRSLIDRVKALIPSPPGRG
uniref:glycosyltransferase family 9 protein n=1 Tax=Phenylobacterium sp. TaxID=1871053 RepID=UPI002FE3185C